MGSSYFINLHHRSPQASVMLGNSSHQQSEIIADRNRLKEALQEITRISSNLHFMGENISFLVMASLELLQMMKDIREYLGANELSPTNAVNKSLAVLGGSIPL